MREFALGACSEPGFSPLFVIPGPDLLWVRFNSWWDSEGSSLSLLLPPPPPSQVSLHSRPSWEGPGVGVAPHQVYRLAGERRPRRRPTWSLPVSA